MTINSPTPTDYPQIYHLLDRAFAPSISEWELVKNLKDRGKISFDFIFEEKGRVLAYVCYSAAYDSRRDKIGFHLAPVGVLPGKQRRGLGKLIITESLKVIGKTQPVYVLGDPEYYRRFGFRKDETQRSSFDPEGRRFMVLSNSPLPERKILYEDEFQI